jgi:hypothetical protein
MKILTKDFNILGTFDSYCLNHSIINDLVVIPFFNIQTNEKLNSKLPSSSFILHGYFCFKGVKSSIRKVCVNDTNFENFEETLLFNSNIENTNLLNIHLEPVNIVNSHYYFSWQIFSNDFFLITEETFHISEKIFDKVEISSSANLVLKNFNLEKLIHIEYLIEEKQA